jgi:5-hydroxyisourate hydrolase-like protein (transthyretin family)
MRGLLLVVLLGTQAAPAQTAQEEVKGSIAGVVISVATNEPIEGASIRLDSETDLEPAVTGPDGKFVFTGLKPGEYNVSIRANGYVRMQYGQKTFPGVGSKVPLNAGEALKGIIVRMTPTATVTGRVRDAETRQPITGVLVQLIRFEYDYVGQRRRVEYGLTRTNDRGEYRLYFVTPGRYYVQVSGQVIRTFWMPERNPNVIVADYPTVYYPGVRNDSEAMIVDVKPGADVSGIDVSVGKPQDTFRIRGRVLDATTGQPPAHAQIDLMKGFDRRWERSGAVATYRADGSFELTPVPAGSYRISVAESGYPASLTPVDVSSDIEGLVVSPTVGVPVTARVRFEGREVSETELKELRISLISMDGFFFRIAEVVKDVEATLLFERMPPGEYRVLTWSPGLYIKEAGFGGLDVLHNTFQIADREANTLNIVISSNVAAVEGAVTNARLEPVANSLVVLVPDNWDRFNLFRTARTDRGTAITLSEMSKQVLTLTVIPVNN